MRCGHRFALGALVVATALLGGCSSQVPTAPTAAVALDADEAERAGKLYRREACSVCHGERAQGVQSAGPALHSLAPYWDEDRLEAYLRDPAAFRRANADFDARRDETYELEMPGFGHVTEQERRLIARWLLTL